MQRSAAFAIMAGLLLVPATATAHSSGGPALNHVQVKPLQLEANASQTVWIETGEGPWQAGMILVLFVSFYNESRDVAVELLFNHSTVVQSWRFVTDAIHKASVRLPFDEGPYELRFTNRAVGQTQLFFYFDQTCNCVAKPVPLDEGWVVFHYDLRAGRTYEIATPVPAQWKLRAVLALGGRETGAWPADFEILQEATLQGAPYWINFTVTPAEDERHFVFYEALEGSPAFPDPGKYVDVTPRLQDLTDDAGGESPGFGLWVALAGLGLGAAQTRGRRR